MPEIFREAENVVRRIADSDSTSTATSDFTDAQVK